MNPHLKTLLAGIGLPWAEESSVVLAGQTRADGYKAAAMGRAEVSRRRGVIDELRAVGLFPRTLEGMVVLDVGCGVASVALAVAGEAKLTVAFDLSHEHCLSAVECVEDQGAGNVAVYQGSFLAADRVPTIPFRARTVDVVMAHHGISRRDLLPLIPDIRGVLKPGGLLFLFVPRLWLDGDNLPALDDHLLALARRRNPDWDGLDRETLVRAAAQAGLDITHHGPATDWTVAGDMFYMTPIFESYAEFEAAGPIPELQLGASTVAAELLVFTRKE